jgi:transcriptional regulator with PAS, ATPase and Fis domain
MTNSQQTSLIGHSAAIVDLREEILRVAASDAKVLITGESGVGKEIVAQAIYSSSARWNAPFVPVNCGGIPETLLESELFGHVKGSFTGAYRDKPGKFELASGGTIFLDEIAEMTLRMQGMFLRFLETGEIQKVGADRVATAKNVRVIAATNRDLREHVVQGLFREDLFYRVNVVHLVVPPLRERRGDIPLLVDHFLANFTARNGRRGAYDVVNDKSHRGGSAMGHSPVQAIAPDAMRVLSEYSWPGNVRQLENVIERLVVIGRREVIEADDLPFELRTASHGDQWPRKDRRRTVSDDLFSKLVHERESFWTTVYPLYMNREITKNNVRDLVHKGLGEARGNYKIMLRMFNMDLADYKRFLSFLRKHDCQLPFKEYRQ